MLKSNSKRRVKVEQQDLSMKQRKNSKFKVKDQQCLTFAKFRNYSLKGQKSKFKLEKDSS